MLNSAIEYMQGIMGSNMTPEKSEIIFGYRSCSLAISNGSFQFPPLPSIVKLTWTYLVQ